MCKKLNKKITRMKLIIKIDELRSETFYLGILGIKMLIITLMVYCNFIAFLE